MSRKIATLMLVATSFGVLISCGRGGGDASDRSPAPTGPQRTVRPGQHGPIVQGEFTFTEALKASGDYSVLYSFADERTDTCSKIASKDATGYVVPLPTFKDEIRLVWAAAVRQYEGPGGYDLSDLERLTLEVRKTPDAKPDEYRAAKGAEADLNVTAKNSGSFEFSGLKNGEGDTISGSAEWSCTEGSEGEG